jgi:pre-mRNA-splicing factor 38A
MANRTDPLINSVSGSDPQNLMEYITRQKIYDSRYWKEECFGLTVSDVLEKSAHLNCIGNVPTKFLSLALKLLQLHPERELVIETFIDQDEFKYTRALGLLYLRMTGRPVEIYETLEPLYRDYRKLCCWNAARQEWSIVHVDEWIHELLTETHVLGMALPRLPARRPLQEANYLEDGPRPSALKDVILEHGSALDYLRYKVEVEKSQSAIEAWEKRRERLGLDVEPEAKEKSSRSKNIVDEAKGAKDLQKEERPTKKPKRNYNNLFKKKDTKSKQQSGEGVAADGIVKDDSYWNDERAKLGLAPLRK